MKHLATALLLATGLATAPAATAVDVRAYVKKDAFNQIKISPDGDHYAATIPREDRTGLVIMRRSDNTLTAGFHMGKNTHVADFDWVNPERVLISMTEKFGALDQPRYTGEIYAISADGSGAELLVGQRVRGAGPGTRIQRKKVEAVVASLVDDLPGDDDHVIISVRPFRPDPYTRAERMNVYSGRRHTIARAPVRNARFVTDNQGVVRFAVGAGTDNRQKLYYRADGDAEWELINNETASRLRQWPIGFAADDQTAYLEAEQAQGPNAILGFEISTGTRSVLLRDDTVDPSHILYRNGSRIPVGVRFIDGEPRTEFIDAGSAEARLYRSLEAAFAGTRVAISSQTADGSLALVYTGSDRSPGDFYVFDAKAKTADHLLSRREWFDPAQMAPMRPFEFKARDGLVVHGYLTVPNGSGGKTLPMVVMPHGGPFGVRDVWGFDSDVQMLAHAGYAVLQVNFRGSGGYGRAFESAGARQWGKAMQDDLTDATHWAMEQGIAAKDRICIYGASYGAYASLMGVAKEPELYRCAVGYVGVYDLPTMHTRGDIQEHRSGETYLEEWIGDPEQLATVSPNRMASRIKAPVFLAAGGEDERTPIEHTEMMEKALREAGVPVETLYYPTEGHGFYVEANRNEYYTRLLAFLSRSLDGKTASVAPAGGAASAAE
ncbi:alpha/beta hydrolase family protein [Lysobacter sp. D1-1-M9]|uniref:alpha/beta hydrolase family protein n=2 Tax=Novilysobacter TaxID=3382699 RepID=UPI002FCB03EB